MDVCENSVVAAFYGGLAFAFGTVFLLCLIFVVNRVVWNFIEGNVR